MRSLCLAPLVFKVPTFANFNEFFLDLSLIPTRLLFSSLRRINSIFSKFVVFRDSKNAISRETFSNCSWFFVHFCS